MMKFTMTAALFFAGCVSTEYQMINDHESHLAEGELPICDPFDATYIIACDETHPCREGVCVPAFDNLNICMTDCVLESEVEPEPEPVEEPVEEEPTTEPEPTPDPEPTPEVDPKPEPVPETDPVEEPVEEEPIEEPVEEEPMPESTEDELPICDPFDATYIIACDETHPCREGVCVWAFDDLSICMTDCQLAPEPDPAPDCFCDNQCEANGDCCEVCPMDDSGDCGN